MVEDEDWADIYDGEEPKKVAEGSSKERKAANIRDGYKKRK